MRKLLLSLFGLACLTGFSQSNPTLASFTVDTLCSAEYNAVAVYNIVVNDANADSTYITIGSYNGAVINNVQVSSPAYIPGETQRVFTITADAGTGLSAGLNSTPINITIIGNTGLDPGVTNTSVTAYVYGFLNSTFDLSTLTMCENDNPIDMRNYASPAGGWFYYSSDTTYMFDPYYYMNNGMGDIYYYFENGAGCQGTSFSYPPTIHTAPVVTVTPSPSTCGNADGSINSYIASGTLPYQLYWSTGFSEVVSGFGTPLNNLPAGNYYLTATDVNGCKAVGIAQISDQEVDLSPTITDETCAYSSQDGGVDLSIVSTLGTVDFIYWSNGQTSSTLSSVHKGSYAVEVRTDAGCEANATYFVSAQPAAWAENVNSTDASCSGSDGIVDMDVYGGSGTFTYNWNNGATTQDLFGVPSGTYTCLITDAVTGCELTFSYQIYSGGGPSIYVEDIDEATCGQATGSIEVNVFSWMNPIASISWSSGHTTADISNISAGNYTITVLDIAGCVYQQTVTVPNRIPERPSICMLTVDSSLTYNMVVWEKDLSQPQITGYNIYRETEIFGNFQLVESRPYGLESIYQDNDASPMDRSWRYYISAYDNCGNESYGSDVHKTIHTVTTTSNSVDYDVHWDTYEGLNYTSVDVHRFDATNGWMTVANLPFGTNTYADTPPVIAGLDYLITFNLSDPCTSTKAQDYNSSRSNKTASVFMPGGSTVAVEDVNAGVISIYPNPVAAELYVHIDQPEAVQLIELTDLNGRVLMRFTPSNHLSNADVSEFAAGVYLIKIYSGSELITQKFVVQ